MGKQQLCASRGAKTLSTCAVLYLESELAEVLGRLEVLGLLLPVLGLLLPVDGLLL